MTVDLTATKQAFIQLAVEYEVLSFGEFVLKSGRTSPYFFNAGKFRSGKAVAVLGECYADAIIASEIEFDVLFGPAYKGIPLVASTAAALYTKYQQEYSICFNRKEAKGHGEGGKLVGAELNGKKALVLDDVVTAGTAIEEVATLLKQNGATLSGVLVGLDRQERAPDSEMSAMQQLAVKYSAPVLSIVTLSDIRQYLSISVDDQALLSCVDDYREQYGV